MSHFIYQHLVHFVALVVLISRLGDIMTTYLASPTLRMEANPIAKWLGWKFALATLLAALIPYYSLGAGIIVGTMSLLVSTSNASKVLLSRALGEEIFGRLINKAVSNTSVRTGLFYTSLPAFFIALLGSMMLVFFPDPCTDWGFYFAVGMLAYALAVLLWGNLSFLRAKMRPRE